MNTKSILLSKTFWLQVVTVLSLAFPQVRAWLDANPETFVAVLGALNVLVRFVTNGKIVIFSAGETPKNINGFLLAVAWFAAGTVAVVTLPSCSSAQWEAARAIPIRIGIQGPDAEASYSSKGGLQINARIRGTK
ncbi:MAG: hypothetical protein Q8Q59_15865 [Luteolibacter sp.]|nr:hypothetical protein [Luteolibacter sp.]